VVVAIIQNKNLKIEAEKGFRRTLFEPELVDPNMEINFVKNLMILFKYIIYIKLYHRKGISLNYTKHVHNEPRVTYEDDLTFFPNSRRAFYST